MQHVGSVVGQRDNLKVIDCKACGFYHLYKLPADDELAAFYQNEFWQNEKAGALAVFEGERDWLDAINGDWVTLVESYSDLVTWLDAGCGYGWLMDAVDGTGCVPYGFDLNSAAITYAKERYGGLVWVGTYDNDSTNYSVISALWLIEHLPDPLEFLLWCHGHLQADGVLLAVVPNDFSAEQKVVMNNGKALPYYWIDKTHINYFTPSSFANLLGRAGFRIVERSTLYPMEQWLKAGYDYTRDPSVGATCHAAVRKMDLNMTRNQRLKLYQGLAAHGMGREIVVVAVKE